MTFDVAFEKLARSKFRSRFKLSDADRKYIAEKGMDTIRCHAEEFVCMSKWWKIPMGVELSAERQQKTVNLIMA